MRTSPIAIIVSAVSVVLTGCAARTTTSKVAVDYNRVFAKSRDEVLVTNILRASAREPLQFSTMGTVTGGVRNTGSIKLPVPSLIGAGATILSPEFTMTEGINPNVNIIPLSNKEFTEGILKPISLETLNFFLNQGWDAEFLLTLAVGGVMCPDGLVPNRGEPGLRYEQFAAMFSKVPRVPIRVKDKQTFASVRLTAKDALTFVKDGTGKGQKIESITPVLTAEGKRTELVDIEMVTVPGLELTGLDPRAICSTNEAGELKRSDNRVEASMSELESAGPFVGLAGQKESKIMLRSVESIIYFLGETHRARTASMTVCSPKVSRVEWPYYRRTRARDGKDAQEALTFFRLDKACGHEPVVFRNFMQTRFNDDIYYILRFADVDRLDRTLTTLSFLNELIALQTSESSITSATPVVTIGTR